MVGEARKNVAEAFDGAELGVAGLLIGSVGMGVGDGVGKGDGSVGSVVSRAGRWDGTIVREEFDGHIVAFSPGGGDVYVVAPVVFAGGTEVPSVNTVGREGTACSRGFIRDHTAPWWGEWGSVKVKRAIELGFCGKAWVDVGWTEEVQREGGMGNEATPEVEGKKGVDAG